MDIILPTLIDTAAQIVSVLLVTLIGVLGAGLTAKLERRAQLANVNAAMQEVTVLAQQTVEELQQTTVAALKEASADGTLSSVEVESLARSLVSITAAKMSKPAAKVLQAAGVDVSALIQSAGESHILKLKEAGS